MDKDKFEFLDDTNLFLGNVTGYADKAFANLTNASQKTVDVTCAEVAYGMSTTIEKARQATIQALHQTYQGYLQVIEKFAPLANMSITDPLALLAPVLEIAKIVCGPYYEALSIMSEMTPKVTELSNNLQKIANYKPPIVSLQPSEGIFDITVGRITMGEIMSGKPIPVNIIKPDIETIKKNAEKPAEIKFQEATSTQADVVTGNRDKNMMTSVDPLGNDGKTGTVNKEQLAKWEEELLGFSNADEQIAARIGILENIIFDGQSYNGALSSRMENLKKGIKVWKKKQADKRKANSLVLSDIDTTGTVA